MRPLHAVAHGVRWLRIPGVTLIGDTAHLAAPAGEGATLALRDGAELAAANVSYRGHSEAGLAAYEAAIFPLREAAAMRRIGCWRSAWTITRL